MNVRKYIFSIVLSVVALYACNNDDDNGGETIIEPPRDRAEQQVKEEEILKKYLETHFYTLEVNSANPDYKIVRFDTIAGENSGKQRLIDSDSLITKEITRDEVKYTLYMLKLNQGATEERKPTFADSTLVTYRGELLYDNQDTDGDGIPDSADVDADGDGQPDTIKEDDVDVVRTDTDGDGIADDSDVDNPELAGKPDSDNDGIIDEKDTVDNNNPDRRIFDNRITPIWVDQAGVIEGWREALVDFKVASGFATNVDGTIDYNDDFGDFTVFVPSGLAYFNVPRPGSSIPLYSALIFNIQLYAVNESDHDRDGIPSYLEDLDEDRLVFDDNTDSDRFANFEDSDDDGDGTQTKDEITLAPNAREDGVVTLAEITFYDDDEDGIPNHLDPDDRDSKNDE